jgi:hypothetical protein
MNTGGFQNGNPFLAGVYAPQPTTQAVAFYIRVQTSS